MNGPLLTVLAIVAAFVGGAFVGKHATQLQAKGDTCPAAPPVGRTNTVDKGAQNPTKKPEDPNAPTRNAFLAALGYDINGKRVRDSVFASKKVEKLPTLRGKAPTLTSLLDVGFSHETAKLLMGDYHRVAHMARLLQGNSSKKQQDQTVQGFNGQTEQRHHPSPRIYQPYSNTPFSQRKQPDHQKHHGSSMQDIRAEIRREQKIAAQYLQQGKKPTVAKLESKGLTKGEAMRVVHDFQKIAKLKHAHA